MLFQTLFKWRSEHSKKSDKGFFRLKVNFIYFSTQNILAQYWGSTSLSERAFLRRSMRCQSSIILILFLDLNFCIFFIFRAVVFTGILNLLMKIGQLDSSFKPYSNPTKVFPYFYFWAFIFVVVTKHFFNMFIFHSLMLEASIKKIHYIPLLYL